MASYRIDNYVFERIKTVLEPIVSVWKDLNIDLALDKDYYRLVRLKKPLNPHELFYPKCSNSNAVSASSTRSRDFLAHLDDVSYHAVYRYFLDYGQRQSLSDPQEAVKRLNANGKTMQAVMIHVVMWLNTHPAKVNDRDSNKPSLIDDLHPVLSPASADGSQTVKEMALGLQRSVLTFVEEHAASFTDPVHRELLTLFPDDDTDPKVYHQRFRIEAWRDVLRMVYEKVGPRFVNPCVTKFNTEHPSGPTPSPKTDLVDFIHAAIIQHPEVVHNSSLSNPRATESLRVMMNEVISQWVVKQLDEVIAAAVNYSEEDEMIREYAAQFRSDARVSPASPVEHRTPVVAPIADSPRSLSLPAEPNDSESEPEHTGEGEDDEVEIHESPQLRPSRAATPPLSGSPSYQAHDESSRESSPSWLKDPGEVTKAPKVYGTQHKRLQPREEPNLHARHWRRSPPLRSLSPVRLRTTTARPRPRARHAREERGAPQKRA